MRAGYSAAGRVVMLPTEEGGPWYPFVTPSPALLLVLPDDRGSILGQERMIGAFLYSAAPLLPGKAAAVILRFWHEKEFDRSWVPPGTVFGLWAGRIVGFGYAQGEVPWPEEGLSAPTLFANDGV